MADFDSSSAEEMSEDPASLSSNGDIEAPSGEGPRVAAQAGEQQAQKGRRAAAGWGGPGLSIAVLVAGTYGDMQPFVVLSLELQREGHRVRLATHANYKKFVEGQGIEFFPLGGDPEFLSKLMVKNHGFMPASLSELSRQRSEFHSILFSTWGACTQRTPGSERPFLADCIIANPPAAGHIHCAEKLGVPLHIVFTMPWSPTWSYPHPLSYSNYKSGSRTLRNRLSYFATETFIYSGTSDIVQKFRVERLGLEKAPTLGGAAMTLQNLKVPFTYAWSPSLAPKPKDWGPHIDVVGFMFLEEPQDKQFQPPPELAAFLEAGPPPVYIGFGSMVCQDPVKLTDTIFRAVQKVGVRTVMNRGWGKFGSHDAPLNVFLIDHTPHSWLFPRCSAVVHHGGAGTTAAGTLVGKPTFIVPFFGDQSMWGELIAKFGCGPHPVRVDDLTEAKLVAGLEFMRTPRVQQAATVLAAKLKAEDGAREAAAAFHRHLPSKAILCHLCPTRLARFVCEECGGLQLSAYADRVIHEGPLASTHGSHRRLHYRPINWHTQHELAYQGLGGALAVFFGELAGTLVGPLKLPVQGYFSRGWSGAVHGVGRGFAGLVTRPLRAIARLGERAGRGLDKALAIGREPGADSVWRYGQAGGHPQKRKGRVAAIENPFQGIRAAGFALAWGFVSGCAALGAWPAAGYQHCGVMGSIGGAAVGVAALFAKVAGAVILSAAALVACIPAGIEALGRQVSCCRAPPVEGTGDKSRPAESDVVLLETLEKIQRQEANEAPLDGEEAQLILDRYATWLAEHANVRRGGRPSRTAEQKPGTSSRRWWRGRSGRRGKVVTETGKEDAAAEKEAAVDIEQSIPERERQVPIGLQLGKDAVATGPDAPSRDSRRWWTSVRRGMLCSNISVR